MTTDIAIPEELKAEIPAVVAQAQGLRVTSPETYEAAGAFLKDVKRSLSNVEAFFKPLKQSADAHKRLLLDGERNLTHPLVQAEGAVKRAMLDYQDAQERIRQAEERRLQDEADRKAREERERLEAKAAKAKRPETVARYQEQAAAVAPAPVIRVAAAVPKANGIATRKVWRYRVTDPLKIPREFLCIDEKKLAKYAAAMGAEAKVEGVQFFQESQLAASSR